MVNSILVGSILLTLCSALEDPIIGTKYGLVQGKRVSNKSYYAFKGIPYAKPPIGELRFKAPEEPAKWQDILKVQENPPHCLQKNYLFANPKVEGSEDCLYLNVYTPKLRVRASKSNNRLFPVMVFIHWGGFFTGYSSSNYLGPDFFMDKEIVLVTFNYRLGVLGFLSTLDDVAPGNYALKDQVAVLKWVQENIEYFGGNKNKVTIFGQSAGGASVNFHMFSPESKHLFHQGISQSGTSLALWAKPLGKEQLLLARTQAKLMGCQDLHNTASIIECLRNVKAEDLVNSGDKFKFFSVDPLTVYLPSVETKTEKNPHPFITKQPIEYIRNKEFNGVPWIVGVVQDEGLIRAEPIIRQKQTRTELNKHFNTLMPNLMQLGISTYPKDIINVWTKIKDFYFINGNTIDIEDKSAIRSLINVYTDRAFVYSSYQTALFHFKQGHDNIWFYNFNYTGQYSYGNVFAATNENINYTWGVSHCDDLLYLFKTPALFPDLQQNDQIVRDYMVNLWTNFAIYGNPTPSQTTRKWLKLDNSLYPNLTKRINFLNIEGDYKDDSPPRVYMKYGFYKNRLKFWEDIPLVENIPELDQQHIDI